MKLTQDPSVATQSAPGLKPTNQIFSVLTHVYLYRIYPVALGASRVLQEDTVLGGYHLPANVHTIYL